MRLVMAGVCCMHSRLIHRAALARSYLAVTRADPHSPIGTSKFVGICIARRNKGLGSTFILRNVLNGMGVEMMYELYSPAIREIQVLKLERRRRAKLYYLRDKPCQSTPP
ncbi:39S ribosomal protein L19, mitochondrial [Geodia barretti]|uniref:Large ribosomal subunit protein bL19m n=1 Tax=Geodia barretti TaxID=519541 RepID=A0AA35W9N9_GEOBA|nr:39S ribosomal protein L19, mitochondrial [Geodia barretti]